MFAKWIPAASELENFYNHYPDYPALSPVTIKRFHEWLDEFEKFRKTNRILDVGCGHGHFLIEAKKRGWEVYGTEFTQKAVDICTEAGCKMQLGDLNAATFPGIEFDVLTSIEVIEHVSTPKANLEEYGRHLRIGGALYITTPNFNSFSRITLKSKWRVITYPEHLNYFSAKVLSRFLQKQGFKISKLSTTGISINDLKNIFISSKANTQTEDNLKPAVSADQQIRTQLEKNSVLRVLKYTLNAVLSSTRTGDTIKLLAIKK